MSEELSTGLQLNNSTDTSEQQDTLQQLQDAVLHVPAGILIYEWHGPKSYKLLLANPAARQLFNIDLNSHEDLNHIMERALHPEDKHCREELANQLKSGVSVASCCGRFYPVGSQDYIWLLIKVKSVYKTSGVLQLYVSLTDITTDKLRSQKYDVKLQLLHTAVRANMLSKCHFDLTEDKLLDYTPHSPNAIKLPIGTSYHAFLQQLIAMTSSHKDYTMIAESMDYDRLMRKSVIGGGDFSIEYKRNCDDLSPIMVECTVNLFQGKNNHAECFLYFYDITNKFINYIISDKLSELGYGSVAIVNKLTGTMTYFSKQTGVIESMPDRPLFYDDELYRFIHKFMPDHRRAERIFQHTRLDYLIEHLDNSADEQMYDYSFDFADPSQKQLLRNRLQACYLDSNRNSIFVIQSDITQQYQEEREQLQRLEAALAEADKANESKSMFLAGISHDMRTPLNGIMSFANFALHTENPQQQKYYLSKIHQSGELLLSLINDTLNLTRLESGKVTVSRERIKTQAMLEELFSSIFITASEHQLSLQQQVAPDVPKYIISDKLKLQGIMLNILSNAIKFTRPEGRVSFSMDIIPPQEQSDQELSMISSTSTKWLRIIIADTGIGMSEDFLPRLFDAFSQEESHEVENPTGTGLGLSIVKKYVDLLEGTINVHSRLGQGTTFEIHIMVEEAAENQVEISNLSRSCHFSQLKILLVEDNPLNQEIATMLLKNKGAAMDIASNGREAVEMFQKSQPGTYQLILMDLRMPIMNGYEATKRIRSCSHPDSKAIPIIAMTADAYEEDIQRCREYGMNSHVSKPINPDVLYREISLHVKQNNT